MYFTILLSLKKVHFVSLIIMFRINWTKKKNNVYFELCLGPPKSQNPIYSILIQFFIVLLMYVYVYVHYSGSWSYLGGKEDQRCFIR